MRRTTPRAAMAAVVVTLAACGASSSGGSGPPPPTGADEVVVRVVTSGGFAAESRRPAQLPQLSVFGDGRVITVGPTTLDYPGPALPNLQESRVTRAGIARILAAARDAGLLEDAAPDYGDPGVTDQATTTVTVRANGVTRRVKVYALGFKGRVSGVTPEQMENRRKLDEFIELAGEPGGTRRYEPSGLAVLVRPSDASQGETRGWPLGVLAGTECVVLEGSDVTTALEAARDAREGDTWVSGGAAYQLTFRSLLPDERSCNDVTTER
jgi:hypothetical protein